MKILWVKAGGLVPLDSGGKIRSFNILKELARKHDITLYTYYGEHTNDTHRNLESLFERVICRPMKIPPPRSLADYTNYARHFFSLHPHSMTRYYRRGILQELRNLAQPESYNVIVCDFLVPARVIPWEVSYPKVLFTHNVEAAIYRRQYETTRNPFWKLVAWREYRLTKRIECRYLRQADHVLTVSDTDRQVFVDVIGSSKITTIPTGVDVEYFHPENEAGPNKTLVFTGSMDYQPNEDAMLFFVKEVFPRIRSRVPEVSLLIVGRGPSSKVRSLATSDQKIQVTGTVEDVRPYITRGAVYVVPLRIGSGTRLKIFEAMAMAKAVVSTSVGAEGLPIRDGVDILIADSADDYALRVTSLLEDPSLARSLGKAARQLVEQKYSWAVVTNQFESALRQLMEEKGMLPPVCRALDDSRRWEEPIS